MPRFSALAAKLAISASLLYFAFARVDLSTLGGRLQQARTSWLAALVVLLTVQLILVAFRWRQIGERCAAPLSVASALRYVLIASFFNQTLPSTIGGDAARIWFVSRAGAGWKGAIYSVVVDRIVGLAVLVAIVAVCLPWLLEQVQDPLGRSSMLLVNGAAIGATAIFLILGGVHWRWLDRWWIMRHIAGTAAISLKVMTGWRDAGLVVGLSIAIHILTVAAVWCAGRSVAAPLEFGQALLLVPPVILIATIPISIAGWGVREGAMMTVFAYAGLVQADGLIVSLLYGIGLFVVGVAGGAFWIAASAPRIAAGEEIREA